MEALFKAYWESLVPRPLGAVKGPRPPVNSSAAMAKHIQTPEDMKLFLESLLGVYNYVDPLHLATRPPYMSRACDQFCPSPTHWIALFDFILSDPRKETLLTQTDEEIHALFASLKHLPNFGIAWPNIFVRWRYERKRLWEARRKHFMTSCSRELIALAMHPRRVERILELGGFEALEDMFV